MDVITLVEEPSGSILLKTKTRIMNLEHSGYEQMSFSIYCHGSGNFGFAIFMSPLM
jgi:hypothetical protein